EEVPHEGLAVFFDEILAAPTTAAIVIGVYKAALGMLWNAMKRYQTDTNPLTDAPTRRVLRFAILEAEDMFQFGDASYLCLVDDAAHKELAPWLEMLTQCLNAASGLDGTDWGTPAGVVPARMHSATPYVYDPVPRRDERFQDLYNQGVNAESFLYNAAYPARA